jgi:hypothetical protein
LWMPRQYVQTSTAISRAGSVLNLDRMSYSA